MGKRKLDYKLHKTIGDNIRQELFISGIKQGDLAKAVGIYEGNFSMKMHAKIAFTVEDIKRIADQLAVPVDDLLVDRN